RKGAIEMVPGTSRGIRLPEPAGLPIVGGVAAGRPILPQENIEDSFDLPGSFFWPRADYLLRGVGGSMINIGSLAGGFVAVPKTDEARDGEIVVARIDDEVTVKRLKRGRARGRLTLLPENDAYEPIEVDLENQSFAIEGISVGVIRRG